MLSPNSSFISTYDPEHNLSTSFLRNGSEPDDRHTHKPDGFKLGGDGDVAVIEGKLHTGRWMMVTE